MLRIYTSRPQSDMSTVCSKNKALLLTMVLLRIMMEEQVCGRKGQGRGDEKKEAICASHFLLNRWVSHGFSLRYRYRVSLILLDLPGMEHRAQPC